MSMSRESQRLKSSRSCMWLNSRNALVQHLSENAIFVFPVLPGSAEAQVIWAGTVKCLLIACLSVTFLPKYQNPFTCMKAIASQRRGGFSDAV